MGTRTYGENADAWLDERFDLRRKREAALSDTLVRRAHWLAPEDRELVLAMFRDGRSAVSIATMTRQDPRLVRRRLKRLAGRLQDPRVAYVVAHHQQWSRGRRAIAQSLFIRGRSMRETTDELGMSFHRVRKHREAIEAMCLADEAVRRKLARHQSTRQWR